MTEMEGKSFNSQSLLGNDSFSLQQCSHAHKTINHTRTKGESEHEIVQRWVNISILTCRRCFFHTSLRPGTFYLWMGNTSSFCFFFFPKRPISSFAESLDWSRRPFCFPCPPRWSVSGEPCSPSAQMSMPSGLCCRPAARPRWRASAHCSASTSGSSLHALQTTRGRTAASLSRFFLSRLPGFSHRPFFPPHLRRVAPTRLVFLQSEPLFVVVNHFWVSVPVVASVRSSFYDLSCQASRFSPSLFLIGLTFCCLCCFKRAFFIIILCSHRSEARVSLPAWLFVTDRVIRA